MKMSALCFGLILMIAFQNPIKNIFYFGQFHEFLELVPDAELPINVPFYVFEPLNHSPYYKEQQPYSISDISKRILIEKYIGPKFVRIPPVPVPIFKFRINHNQFAVFYSYDARRHQTFYLRIFDKNGNTLDTHQFFNTGNPETNIVAYIDSNKIIEKKIYDVIWKKDFEEYGFKDNEKMGREYRESIYYKINENGKFEYLKKTEEKILNDPPLTINK